MIEYKPKGIPDALKQLPRWALSAPDQENYFGKLFSEKAPIIPIAGKGYCRGVKPNDSSTWQTFDTVDAWQDRVGGYPGIMIAPPYVGIDFDLEKGSDEYRAWVEKHVLPSCPAYVEKSPSGNGYRIIIEGAIAHSRRTPLLEVYDRDRFLRMTGETVVVDAPKMQPQEWLDWVYPSAGADIDHEHEAFVVDHVTGDEAKRVYDALMPTMRDSDRVSIEQADSRQAEGSDACFQVCVALAKVPDMDASIAYTILLALEGVQDYYQQKYAADAPKELHRKFTNYWWPDALRKAKSACAKDAAEDKLADELKEATKGSEEVREKAIAPKKEQKLVRVPDLPDSRLIALLAKLYDDVTRGQKGHYQWREISVLFAAGVITSACYRSGSASTPAFAITAKTGQGKENVTKFLNLIIRVLEGNLQQSLFDHVASVSSGQTIRDVVSDMKMVVLTVSEAKHLYGEIGDGNPAFQEFLPNAIDGTPIARGARAASSKDKEKEAVKNPRLAVYFATQPQNAVLLFTNSAMDGGTIGRLTYFPNQERPRDQPPEYVETRPVDIGELVKYLMHVEHRARKLDGTTWVSHEDSEGFSRRLDKEFPPMGKLEPIHARLGQLVIKWATLHFALRDLDARQLNNLDGGSSWLQLEPQDIDYGFKMARMSVDTLRNLVGWSDLNSVSIGYHLVYQGALLAVRMARARKSPTVGLGLIHQRTPERLRAGKPAPGDVTFSRDRKLAEDICNELESEGVFTKGTRSAKQTSFMLHADTEKMLETRIAETAP